MQDPYHIKYRPQKFSEVLGNKALVKSLQSALEGDGLPHSYLFTGPSGVGKTTLARIVGMELKVNSRNLLEIDAATNSGVDDMRRVKTYVETPGFGSDSRRMVIIDECHSLSKNAWQSWLKIVEEPPEHLFFAFCTTETHKVPKTIKTRCHSYDLKPVPAKEIEKLLEAVTSEEQLAMDRTLPRVISQRADGSVRQALVFLSMVKDCKSKKKALQVLDETDVGPDAIKLCRVLMQGANFDAARKIVAAMDDGPMEGVRIVILNYFSKVLAGGKNAEACMAVLEEFSEPFRDYERKAPLYLALGRLLLG